MFPVPGNQVGTLGIEGLRNIVPWGLWDRVGRISRHESGDLALSCVSILQKDQAVVCIEKSEYGMSVLV